MMYSIQKRLMGEQDVVYDCPGCGSNLISPLSDAGKRDHCPHCERKFVVPGSQELRSQSALHREREMRRIAEREAREAENKRPAAQGAYGPAVFLVSERQPRSIWMNLILVWFLSLFSLVLALVIPFYLLFWVPFMCVVTLGCILVGIKRLIFG